MSFVCWDTSDFPRCVFFPFNETKVKKKKKERKTFAFISFRLLLLILRSVYAAHTVKGLVASSLENRDYKN